MLAKMLRKFDTQVPWLGTLLGSRPELEVPAYMVSLTVHALFLVLLGLVGHRVHQVVRQFHSQVLDNALNTSESTYQNLDQGAEAPSLIPPAGSFASNLATTIILAPNSASTNPVAANPSQISGASSLEFTQLDMRGLRRLSCPLQR